MVGAKAAEGEAVAADLSAQFAMRPRSTTAMARLIRSLYTGA